MPKTHGFERVCEHTLEEYAAQAVLYRHAPTGAELLSIVCPDENKVFGVTLRTPPADSSGLPHILEHSVLCGSRKYPVKEPFVELLKSSLQTFLNAFTYPDKTCYPVASANTQDFYNLVDVYLDAVFFPRIPEEVFGQEGWHLEPEGEGFIYKGVVYNEMKGAYSSPDSLLAEYSQRLTFPDTTYGVDSGGDPAHIPTLTYKAFKDFHARYYHPSNARFFFYGDDDPERRLAIVAGYLEGFNRQDPQSAVALQMPFDAPRSFEKAYDCGPINPDHPPKASFTLNWLLPDTTDPAAVFALAVLEHTLIGLSASPLRKALIESGLGEDMAGVGLEAELRQMYFSTGLKGVEPENIGKAQELVVATLEKLEREGVPAPAVEAALNTLEFRLRENNTGSFPRGLSMMLRALTTWLHGGDPLAPLRFAAPLEALKARLAAGERVLEGLIRAHLLDNPHRVSVVLTPDPLMGQRLAEEETQRVKDALAAMDQAGLEKARELARRIESFQHTPDSPDDLDRIPKLRLADLPRQQALIPGQWREGAVFHHDLPTNSVIYVDLAFDLSGAPAESLPLVGLFGRALCGMGTSREDFASFLQRIARKTGGVGQDAHLSALADGSGPGKAAARLVVRAKATPDKAADLADILAEALTDANFDDKKRFGHMLLETKARLERQVVTSGHVFAARRLRARFDKASAAAETLHGLDALHAIRALSADFDAKWPEIRNTLDLLRTTVLTVGNLTANVTLDRANFEAFEPVLAGLFARLPAGASAESAWPMPVLPACEGLAAPVQVNYVAKGASLAQAGYTPHGSMLVACRHLRNAYLWERVRVRGGAYGAFCSFDRWSGMLTLVSYRDPNILPTLETFSAAGDYLAGLDLSPSELERAVIGAVGDLDAYQLPDAKGYTALVRHLANDSEKSRQQLRQEVMSTTLDDLRQAGQAMRAALADAPVVVLGSGEALAAVQSQLPGMVVTPTL